MTDEIETIRGDFDRIAEFPTPAWNHNGHYHGFLLKSVPSGAKRALEIGCGQGDFSRLLAGRCNHVTALDLSPEMIRRATTRSREFPNIDFEIADVLEWDFPADGFDFVVSIATLHHLPTAEILAKMKAALKPGGGLAVLDLFEDSLIGTLSWGSIAVPVGLAFRLLKTGRLREPIEVRRAWDAHAVHDSYLTLEQVRDLCREILPGAVVRRHLFWRYSIVWKKPWASKGDELI